MEMPDNEVKLGYFTTTEATGCVYSGRMKKWTDYSWLTFPLVLFWLIGIGTGIYMSKTYFNYKLIEAVKMNRIMIQTVVYDLMPYDSAMGQVKK